MVMAKKKKESPKSARHKKAVVQESPSRAMKAVKLKKKAREVEEDEDEDLDEEEEGSSEPLSRVDLIRMRHEFLKKEIDKIRTDLEAETDD